MLVVVVVMKRFPAGLPKGTAAAMVEIHVSPPLAATPRLDGCSRDRKPGCYPLEIAGQVVKLEPVWGLS